MQRESFITCCTLRSKAEFLNQCQFGTIVYAIGRRCKMFRLALSARFSLVSYLMTAREAKYPLKFCCTQKIIVIQMFWVVLQVPESSACLIMYQSSLIRLRSSCKDKKAACVTS